MSQTLFLKDNKPHVRLSQGEFEVTSECYTKGTSRDGESTWFNVSPTKDKTVGISEGETFEWPYGVELIELPDEGRDMSGPPYPIVDFKTVARLIPEEKKAESAYKEFEGKREPCAYEEECQHPACNCGKMIEPFNKECPKCRTKDFASCHSMHCPVRKPVESSEPQEKEPYVLEVVGNFLHSSGLVFNTDDADHVASDLIRYLKVEGISIAKAAPSESQEDKITRLERELKVSEYLKELADDAIVTLQKENKALEEKFNKLIYDFYEKEEAAQFPDETMTYKQYQQFTRAAFTVIKSENKALREEIERLKADNDRLKERISLVLLS